MPAPTARMGVPLAVARSTPACRRPQRWPKQEVTAPSGIGLTHWGSGLGLRSWGLNDSASASDGPVAAAAGPDDSAVDPPTPPALAGGLWGSGCGGKADGGAGGTSANGG